MRLPGRFRLSRSLEENEWVRKTRKTRKTMLSWELEGGIVVTPLPQGSRIDLLLNTHHNRPVAMMDKMKNDKSAKKLMEKLTAAV